MEIRREILPSRVPADAWHWTRIIRPDNSTAALLLCEGPVPLEPANSLSTVRLAVREDWVSAIYDRKIDLTPLGRRLMAATALLNALQQARAFIAEEHDNLVESSTLKLPDGSPDLSTLEAIDAESIAQVAQLLRDVDAALTLAGEQPTA